MKTLTIISIIIAVFVSYEFHEESKSLREKNNALIHMMAEYDKHNKELISLRKTVKRLKYELDKYNTICNQETNNEIIRDKE